MSNEDNKLTLTESADFNRLEKVIEKNKQAWVDVGLALSEIRARKLYRRQYATFEEYTLEKWGWGASRARQLIGAATVDKQLENESVTTGNSLTERAARELVSVKKEKRGSVVKAIKDAGKEVTSGTIKAEVKKAEDEKKKKEPQLDGTGYPIPEDLLELWNRGSEPEEIIASLARIRRGIRHLDEDRDILYVEAGLQGVHLDLHNAITSLKRAVPFAVCTQCQGHPKVQPGGKCPTCKGRGFISEFLFKTCVPEEIKNIRAKGTKK